MVAAACLLFPGTGRPAEDAHHQRIPHHHIALVGGGGLERDEGHSDRAGFAFGLAYEYRFHERWGIGFSAEGMGSHTSRDEAYALPVSYHLTERWRLFAGPGFEAGEDGNAFLIRLGAGYEIPIAERWSLAPELVADIVEGDRQLFILGISIGYEF